MCEELRVIYALIGYTAALLAIALWVARPELKEMFRDFKDYLNNKP